MPIAQGGEKGRKERPLVEDAVRLHIIRQSGLLFESNPTETRDELFVGFAKGLPNPRLLSSSVDYFLVSNILNVVDQRVPRLENCDAVP